MSIFQALPPGTCPRLVLGLVLASTLSVPVQAQGAIRSWGIEPVGAPTGSGFVQLSAGHDYVLALREDGSIAAWGSDNNSVVSAAPTGNGYVQVAAGAMHCLALRADGSIQMWGSDHFNQIGSAPTQSGFVQITAGWAHSVAIHSDGSVHAWGHDNAGQVFEAPAGNDFAKVASNWWHSLALKTDGSLVTWGAGDPNGPLAMVPPGTGYLDVATGLHHSLAIRADGTLVSWGVDSHQQVSGTPGGDGFIRVAAGDEHSVAVRSDGTLVSWGRDHWDQVTDTPMEAIFGQVSAGGDFSVALTLENSGTGFCFGDGSGAACPCGASGAISQGGCLNTGSLGALLVGSGHASLSADSFQLDVSHTPGNNLGLLLRGIHPLNSGLGVPVGDGLLCTGGQAARSQVQLTSMGATTFVDFQGSPFGASSYGAGIPTHYQFWYRDPANSCSGLGFNFSSAWTVTWEL